MDSSRRYTPTETLKSGYRLCASLRSLCTRRCCLLGICTQPTIPQMMRVSSLREHGSTAISSTRLMMEPLSAGITSARASMTRAFTLVCANSKATMSAITLTVKSVQINCHHSTAWRRPSPGVKHWAFTSEPETVQYAVPKWRMKGQDGVELVHVIAGMMSINDSIPQAGVYP